MLHKNVLLPLRVRQGLICCLLALTAPPLSARETSIVDAHLVSKQSGWALVGDRLLWTDDLGATWKDITPSSGPAQNNGADWQVSGAAFLDKSMGWVALSQVDPISNDTVALSIKRTVDGGISWQAAKLIPRKDSTFKLFLYRGALFSFCDRLHGWMLLPKSSSIGISLANLFATEDGGATWTELSDPPIAGYVKLVTSTMGWISGGAGADDELYRTIDGGKTWKRQIASLSGGDTSEIDTSYGLPSFQEGSTQVGVLPVIFSADPAGRSLVVYETTDSGAIWKPQARKEQFGPGQGIAVTTVGKIVYWAHLMNGVLITGSLPGSGRKQVTAPTFNSQTGGVTLYSVVSSSAFAVISQEDCPPNDAHCWQRYFLMATSNGREFVDRTPLAVKPIPMPPHRIVKPLRNYKPPANTGTEQLRPPQHKAP